MVSAQKTVFFYGKPWFYPWNHLEGDVIFPSETLAGMFSHKHSKNITPIPFGKHVLLLENIVFPPGNIVFQMLPDPLVINKIMPLPALCTGHRCTLHPNRKLWFLDNLPKFDHCSQLAMLEIQVHNTVEKYVPDC